MNLLNDYQLLENRRQFLARGRNVLGYAALSQLMGGAGRLLGAEEAPGQFPAKAKHVIYLHMVGGPSQIDLWDHKPKMNEWYD